PWLGPATTTTLSGIAAVGSPDCRASCVSSPDRAMGVRFFTSARYSDCLWRMLPSSSGSEAAIKPGDTVRGKYKVERVLASGGMGLVVLASHVMMHKRVALKLIKPGLARDRDTAERFLREARAASK